MTYNVGPDFRRAANDSIECHDCGELIHPVWDGADGIWICPCCYAELPDYEESTDDQ